MTVWIVNPFDNLPPEGYRPQRYWLMSRAFAEAGHQVTYWTSDFSHAHKAPRQLEQPVATGGFRLVLAPTKPYRANICLRIGERVLIELGSFEAKTFDELFEYSNHVIVL